MSRRRDEGATGCVVDASALLAMLHGESGGESVEAVLDGGAISTVNWSEVCQRSSARGVDAQPLRAGVQALGLEILDFTAADAERAAELWPPTRHLGLSLGDRACLALAARLERSALTADRSWLQLEVGVEIASIR